MKQHASVQKLALAGLFSALAVSGSLISFPVLGSKCAPIQHMVNILSALLLGPWGAFAVAFTSSFLRNLLGLGSLLAFPGSMCGALVCGLIYQKTKSLPLTLLGEILGTGILGGLLAYPTAVLLMGKSSAHLAITVYILPFLISTVAGSLLAGTLIFSLNRSGVLRQLGLQARH
ncbi:energy coupling factor transporter S component ThiW [Proteiniclasticum sp. QWL-01]|jgi:energy coupling factor transporter S component ThiW|uniref:energy coupling factor transporter S component ThiW n=1 Tax=Proteiniclasticum sp. QWL-01 TaxID=3036945 RepID=UPI0024119549|nr:energy coupling factor transporter S component ThiW [Proteiniclasticum sp. QWL-01]WFF74305.1 energy coupling factor transporter S component ThiW [Proteiniclasticum sp. QWL-01]